MISPILYASRHTIPQVTFQASRSHQICLNRSDPDKPEDGPRKGAVVKHSSDTSLRDEPNFHLESGPLRGTLSPFQVPDDFQNSDLDQNRRERRPREEFETVVYPVKFKIAFAHPAKYIVPRGDDKRPRSDDFPIKIMQQQSATNIAPREAVTTIVKAMNPDRGQRAR